MAVPVVAIAAKFVAQKAVVEVQKRFPGGIVGAIAAALAVIVLIAFVGISAIIGVLQVVSPVRDSTDQCIAFPDSGSMSAPPDELNWTGGNTDGAAEPVVDTGAGTGTVAPAPEPVGGDVASSNKVVVPVPAGKYRLSSPYGMRFHPIRKIMRMHKGLDYAPQPKGSRVEILAAADGVVTRSGPVASFGQWITIKHNINGVTWTTLYAHERERFVKVGDTVTAGQPIAIIGSEGDSTGPHLHFQVHRGDYSQSNTVDPAGWLASNGAVGIGTPIGGGTPVADQAEVCQTSTAVANGSAGPWGGHQNGQIPASELCAPAAAPNHRFRCDAAKAFDAMSAEYEKTFNKKLSITDSYRDYAGQVLCRQNKGNLCAKPGTSNHGWALAMDAAGGIENFGTPQHIWMTKNAGKFGWMHPSWAQQSGSKPEPWHWEYVGTTTSGGAAGDGKTPASAKALAQSMLPSYGWGPEQFSCVDKLWEKESNWNYKAKNPTSSATGIPQAMVSIHFKEAAARNNYLNNPSVQITWGLKYISDRYSNPCAAWAHSQRVNWY